MRRRDFVVAASAAAGLAAVPGGALAGAGTAGPLVLSCWDDGPRWEGLKVYALHRPETMRRLWPEAERPFQLGCVFYTESEDGVDMAVRTMLTLEVRHRMEHGELCWAVRPEDVRPEFRDREARFHREQREHDLEIRRVHGLTAEEFPVSRIVRERVDMMVRGSREALARWDREVPSWWRREEVPA